MFEPCSVSLFVESRGGLINLVLSIEALQTQIFEELAAHDGTDEGATTNEDDAEEFSLLVGEPVSAHNAELLGLQVHENTLRQTEEGAEGSEGLTLRVHFLGVSERTS